MIVSLAALPLSTAKTLLPSVNVANLVQGTSYSVTIPKHLVKRYGLHNLELAKYEGKLTTAVKLRGGNGQLVGSGQLTSASTLLSMYDDSLLRSIDIERLVAILHFASHLKYTTSGKSITP